VLLFDFDLSFPDTHVSLRTNVSTTTGSGDMGCEFMGPVNSKIVKDRWNLEKTRFSKMLSVPDI
jgi:hypothetical protein